jgi:hypothetical protein
VLIPAYLFYKNDIRFKARLAGTRQHICCVCFFGGGVWLWS